MFFQIRRLLKHSAVYGLGHVLTRMVSFLLLPYLTHYMAPEQYGALTLIYTFIALALVIYGYGFDMTFLRYYILETDPQRRRDIFGTVFWVSLGTSVLFSLAVLAAGSLLTKVIFENPSVAGGNPTYLILLSAGIMFCENLGMYPYLYLRAVEKSVPYILMKLLGISTHIGLTLVLISGFHRGIAGVFEANFIASLLQLALLLPLVLRNLNFRILFDRLGEFLRFGLPNLPSQIFVMLVELADRKLLELLIGIGIVGIYSAGYKLGLFMSVVTLGFRFAWQPFFLSIADQPDAKETFARVFTYYLLATGTLFFLLDFTIYPLMTTQLPYVGVLIDKNYWEGLKVFPIILLAHICNGANANFMVGVYLKKKTSLLPIVTGVAALVNIVSNLIFIPIYGMWAAAWNTLIAYFTLAALLYILIQPHYRIQYEWKRIWMILGCGGVIYLLSLIPFLQPYWYMKLLLIPVFFVLLKMVKFFLPDEISAVRRRLAAFKAS
ncbi:MAG: oligosaccharide flippase family protein [bacterium]|nr:oligosaccharide flippase family protein [bacterium]